MLATGLGLGATVPAPGTVAALVWGMPLAWVIGQLPDWWWQLAVVSVLCAAGVPLCTRAGRDLGGRKDHQAIVWDEIVTVPIAFLIIPMRSWIVALVGFLIVRVMDISKPPPIRRLERLAEGRGIMADDVLAGVYSALLLALIVRVFHL
jgi:phosphatidylglycerophosphatase A